MVRCFLPGVGLLISGKIAHGHCEYFDEVVGRTLLVQAQQLSAYLPGPCTQGRSGALLRQLIPSGHQLADTDTWKELEGSLLPTDLTAAEVDGFFEDAAASWRPYAAGMVWEGDSSA